MNLLKAVILFFIIPGLANAQEIKIAMDKPQNPSAKELYKTDHAGDYICKSTNLNSCPKQSFVGLVYQSVINKDAGEAVLYINGDSPGQTLTILIANNKLSNKEVQRLTGYYAFVTGVITTVSGKPAIKLSGWNEISFQEPFYKEPLSYRLIGDQVKPYYKSLSEFSGDTVSYLFDNFLFHQNIYKRKSLSYLISKINLPINGISFITAENTHQIRGINIEFDELKDINKKTFQKMPAVLKIYFAGKMEKKDIRLNKHPYSGLIRAYGQGIIDSVSYWHF